MAVLTMRHVWGLAGLAVAICLVGCGGSSHGPREMPADKVHILKFGTIWQAYRQEKGIPTSIDQMKTWAKALKKERLDQMGIQDVDKAFISPRDNEPYQLAPPQKNNPAAKMGIVPLVGYEKTGVGGKRLMVTGMGSATEVTDEELKKSLSGS